MSAQARQNGFTLIELAIVMAISGLLLVGAARTAHIAMQARMEDATHEAQADIAAALQSFLDLNGRLPCPAPLNAAPDSDTFGYEVTDTCNAAASFSGTFRDDSPRGTVRIGAVPTRTLNIADERAFDGWGRRFTYAVSAALADTSILYDGSNGAIDLVDGDGNPLVTPPASGVLVIVSHARDGNGAYNRVGSARPCDTGRLDGQNCGHTARFRSTLRADDNFDNVVRFTFPDDRLFHLTKCGKIGRLYSPEDPAADAEGCIVASPLPAILTCNAAGRLYSPGHAAADGNGCILPPGLAAVLNCGESVQIYDGSTCVSP